MNYTKLKGSVFVINPQTQLLIPLAYQCLAYPSGIALSADEKVQALSLLAFAKTHTSKCGVDWNLRDLSDTHSARLCQQKSQTTSGPVRRRDLPQQNTEVHAESPGCLSLQRFPPAQRAIRFILDSMSLDSDLADPLIGR